MTTNAAPDATATATIEVNRDTFFAGLDVRTLDDDVDITAFDCDPNIDWFLCEKAKVFQTHRLSNVMCWVGKDRHLVGFVTTSMDHLGFDRNSVDKGVQVEDELKGLKTWPRGEDLKRFPALLIGQLGVSKQYRRLGVGEAMVEYAIGQARNLSREVGCRYVMVHAEKTDAAVALYKKKDFTIGKTMDHRVVMYLDLGPRDEK